MSSNGFVVPLPSETFVPSINPVAGYTKVLSTVGILGEGRTNGSFVSSNVMDRFQCFILMTVTSALIRNSLLKNVASSPVVIPCLNGIG